VGGAAGIVARQNGSRGARRVSGRSDGNGGIIRRPIGAIDIALHPTFGYPAVPSHKDDEEDEAEDGRGVEGEDRVRGAREQAMVTDLAQRHQVHPNQIYAEEATSASGSAGFRDRPWGWRDRSRSLRPTTTISRSCGGSTELFTTWPFLGSRRMTAMLRVEGHAINRNRVRRLMRKRGITTLSPKPHA
jgi:HTH-like domain